MAGKPWNRSGLDIRPGYRTGTGPVMRRASIVLSVEPKPLTGRATRQRLDLRARMFSMSNHAKPSATLMDAPAQRGISTVTCSVATRMTVTPAYIGQPHRCHHGLGGSCRPTSTGLIGSTRSPHLHSALDGLHRTWSDFLTTHIGSSCHLYRTKPNIIPGYVFGRTSTMITSASSRHLIAYN